MHVAGEPPKSGLAIKINNYLAMAKAKQIQSLSEQSNNSYLNVQDQFNLNLVTGIAVDFQ